MDDDVRRRRDLHRPQVKDTDTLGLRGSTKQRNAGEVERLVLEATAAIHDPDEEHFQRALFSLGERGEEIARAIINLERSAPYDPVFRWGLYYVAAGLRRAELADLFVDGATRDLPEITEDSPHETAEEAEILVAAMAVEGLERLAAVDEERAIRGLTEVVERQPHVAIRLAAVQALREIRPDAAASASRRLPEDQAWIVDARRMPVQHLDAMPERAGPKRGGDRPPSLSGETSRPTVDRKGG